MREKLGTLKAGVVAGSMALNILNHGPVQAAESLELPTWQAGVDASHHDVLTNSVETGRKYLEYKDGTVQWVSFGKPVNGKRFSGLIVDPEKEAEDMQRIAAGRTIAKICSTHTHQLKITKRLADPKTLFKLFGKKVEQKALRTPYAPPSGYDANLKDSSITLKYAEGALSPFESMQAVFDPHGIWYLRAATAQEIQQANEKLEEIGPEPLLFEDVDMFGPRSQLPEFDFEKEYYLLKLRYVLQHGKTVRFVSYEDAKKEPACAGVDVSQQK